MEKIIGIDMYGNETELNASKLVCEKCVDENGLDRLDMVRNPRRRNLPVMWTRTQRNTF